ncbi:alpha/beta hydrolase-fold protein [uncultured Megasphaera sp.]|uniref:alpha/beta hydrolase-fold protein n=1 Tax=uncultured Megasphaera sp. TaxID=165188 RepID=UPI0025DD6246|nr:alpha/beta hydrolase-fold protein [uncultured Megasphaera sp.]
MKGKTISAMAAFCCLLSLTANVFAAAPADRAQVTAVTTAAATAAASSVRDVTALCTPYSDGEGVSAVALHYPKDIDASRLQTSDFSVAGRTVDKVYTNDAPAEAAAGKKGPYVIVSLAHAATPLPAAGQQGSRPKDDGNKKDDKGGALSGGDAPMFSDRKAPDLSISVSQSGTVYALDGTAYAPNSAARSADKTVDPVIDSFKTYIYKDPATGYEMPYNIYLPAGYDQDKAKTYPMVVFIADASADINDPKAVLYQGNGATVWAAPAEQAKHPAIVLAPQYTEDLIRSIGMMTTDTHQWTKGLSLVTDLIMDVRDRYRVDKDRIYGTGQSQGGMANIAISDKYPQLFAAQYLVACQWDTQEMEALKDKKLWITVCQGDTKAFPGMNEATALWEKDGATVARSKMWDSTGGTNVFEQMMKVMKDQDAPINYTVFQNGNHMYTWTFAYNIEGSRDWIFEQKL